MRAVGGKRGQLEVSTGSWRYVRAAGGKFELEGGVRVLERMPVVIFIKFPEAKWTLAPLKEPGLYPIKPKRATWFIDKGRQKPILAVQRQQLPVAPAFALTSHAAQGQTFLAAIVDLQIGRGTSPIGSYVDITRVKKGRICSSTSPSITTSSRKALCKAPHYYCDHFGEKASTGR